MLDLKLAGHQACDNLHIPRGFFDAANFDCRRTVLCEIFRQRMQNARLQPITCALWAARRLAGQERAVTPSLSHSRFLPLDANSREGRPSLVMSELLPCSLLGFSK